MAEFILPLEKLIEQFRKLPGIGRKTAVRLAFAVLDYTPEEADAFAAAVQDYNARLTGSLTGRLAMLLGVEPLTAQ